MKNIISNFWQIIQENTGKLIMENLFGENIVIELNRINIFPNKSVQDRKYFIIPYIFDISFYRK